jgi:hypothetical protein
MNKIIEEREDNKFKITQMNRAMMEKMNQLPVSLVVTLKQTTTH